ncbi:Ig-like domain-containing protein [Lipingzhangella sp. LS1_29]|uniref:Ig-like domain-containing protein n=1 Tax=Lipingzhangella rawalii TaxID=2055835 RepID=A0ABU2H052_9ACTN|nr:Ig-like domain-containing protein [Lipingzhangella rawalii]MDS1268687.1 Ig-like domain-containing protein [Lipingzhangella rawalii]
MHRSVVRPTVGRAGAGFLGAVVLLTTACSGSTGATTSGTEESTDAGAEAGDAVETSLEISPQDGETELRPDTPITVTAEDGTIDDVAVSAPASGSADDGDESQPAELDEITGTFNDDETQWTSDWTLPPGTSVSVTATATGEDGDDVQETSEFTTQEVPAGQRLGLESNFPQSGDTVGVGMPVIVNFTRPVHNKEQVEAAMEVVSEEPTLGAWNWFGDQMAVFRTEDYWEPYQNVTVNLRLAGVRSSQDVYGTDNYQIDFEVGREMISEMSVPDHEMVVSVDGAETRTIEVTNGAETEHFDTTMSGTQLTMEKYEHYTMDSATVGIPEDDPGYYRLDVQWAVRISNSGEFIHGADWHDDFGERNTSNGCTNLRHDDAEWFYDQALMGDPVITTGTDRQAEVDNGWGYWQRDWQEWLDHSELDEPQHTDTPGTPARPFLQEPDED